MGSLDAPKQRLPPPHLSHITGGEEARACPPCGRGTTRRQGRGGKVQEDLTLLSCLPPTDCCLCGWKLGGAGKLGKGACLCVQVAVEASSRSSDLHWDVPVSLQQEREPEYRVESQKETAEHHL